MEVMKYIYVIHNQMLKHIGKGLPFDENELKRFFTHHFFTRKE
ncbi:hypothetical protein XIS1_1030009 [Xenorhabdus innexi]|uniref:Uncharacterized protein n=1 Tax=Xenorhabdus innexi TaxID=290109 RepID=A0A1N6MQ63_9GAMM|nr:hypothetical protein XIS1_1030009 [Xenorhabdus innexi]